jgi:hypothetical protein
LPLSESPSILHIVSEALCDQREYNIMGGQGREGPYHLSATVHAVFADVDSPTGGKAKPLKAAKKEKKDLDEDDLAYKEKQRAGQ